MADRDCYEVLGVARDATADQIKKAYRALARKHHPDANPGDKTAEAKFKEVQNAYDILSDAEKKSRYDQFGHAAFDGSGPFGPRGQGTEWAARQAGPGGFENIDFSSLFGGARPGGATAPGDGAGIFEDIMTRMRGERGGRRRSPGQPRETEASLTIPFFTAVRGGETTIELDRGDGRLESKVIKIPPGLESGKKIRLRGQGDSTGQGDLVIHVTVEPHPYFHRDGQDITVEVPLTVAEAILGTKVEVPTIQGFRSVTIPAGTSSGQKLRLRGQGVPGSRNQPDGDLYALIKVVIPKKIDDESRHLIEQFAERHPGNPREGIW